mmetsp:Transcript_1295/g.4251  ORF Transcript_1295/g.4251 Transcript_1295/m.4251 type:complete len:81 (+) Transcript_1295:1610-1852(+)
MERGAVTESVCERVDTKQRRRGLQRHLELLLVRFQQPFCNGKLGTSAKVDVDAALSLESPVKLLAQAIAHTSVGELVSKA